MPVARSQPTGNRLLELTVQADSPHVEFFPSPLSFDDAAVCHNDSLTDDVCSHTWWKEHLKDASHGAVESASQACSLQLVFQGVSIDVLGVRDEDGARALVSIDGGEAAVADFGSIDGTRLFGETVFSSGSLSNGSSHTLNLSYDPDSTGRRAEKVIRVDAFIIKFPDVWDSPFVTSTPIHISTSQTRGTSLTDPTATDDTTTARGQPAIAGPQETPRGASKAKPAMVAGICVGVGLLVAVIMVVVYRCRRRRAAQVSRVSARGVVLPAIDSAFPLAAGISSVHINVSSALRARDDKLRSLAEDKTWQSSVLPFADRDPKFSFRCMISALSTIFANGKRGPTQGTKRPGRSIPAFFLLVDSVAH